QHVVTDLDLQRNELTGLVARAWTDRKNFALHGLFLCRVGDDDATGCSRVLLDAAHENAVVERAKLHGFNLDRFGREFASSTGRLLQPRSATADRRPAALGRRLVRSTICRRPLALSRDECQRVGCFAARTDGNSRSGAGLEKGTE